MKIQLLSDLHLEFWMRRTPRIPPIINLHPQADVVVLAGDIVAGDDQSFLRAYSWIKEAMVRVGLSYRPHILIVSGNHEHYARDIDESLAFQKQLADEYGFFFLEDGSITIKDVRFYGCTLWSDYALLGSANVDAAMTYSNLMLSDRK